MKTAEAHVLIEGANMGSLSNDDLQRLSQVIIMAGSLKFNVKGYSRGDPTSIENSEKIMLLVEGGTITFDDTGIIGSTGNARILLEFAFGSDVHVAGSDGERRVLFQTTVVNIVVDMVNTGESVDPAQLIQEFETNKNSINKVGGFRIEG
mmetsp:Transcript_7465/g.7653  ORF Transcript_7465/g.7653 Transcript_7465/m.7653 type:complete len:150 (+) Transcript_7465:907-1356(+)